MKKKELPSLSPDIRLFGPVDQAMLSEFFRQQAQAPAGKPVVMELSTLGGDADMGRRIAQEIRLWREKQGCEIFFLGKTFVYSAGITVMAAFPVTHRFLTQDCELLIHERKMQKQLELRGSLRICMSAVNDALAEIESGQRLEKEGFAQLVQGTPMRAEALAKKVCDKDWYLGAREALQLGLVGGLV